MKVVKKFIYPNQWFLALFLKMQSERLLACSMYPRIDRQGFVLALPAQRGCTVGCNFCSVPNYFGDLTPDDIEAMIRFLKEHYPFLLYYGNYKYSFVKGGELLLNRNCPEILERFGDKDIKISSVLPKTRTARRNMDALLQWYEKAHNHMTLSLQVSALSTSEKVRSRMSHPLMSFDEIQEFGQQFFKIDGRKVTLSFTCTDTLVCNPEELAKIISPDNFAIRLYPYKKNAKHLDTLNAGALENLESRFRGLGYTIIPCTNPFGVAERGLGYFDPQNEIIQNLEVPARDFVAINTPAPRYKKRVSYFKSDALY